MNLTIVLIITYFTLLTQAQFYVECEASDRYQYSEDIDLERAFNRWFDAARIEVGDRCVNEMWWDEDCQANPEDPRQWCQMLGVYTGSSATGINICAGFDQIQPEAWKVCFPRDKGGKGWQGCGCEVRNSTDFNNHRVVTSWAIFSGGDKVAEPGQPGTQQHLRLEAKIES